MKAVQRFEDIQQACQRAKNVVPANEVESNEIGAHLLVSVLGNAKDSFESIIDYHGSREDKLKGQAICKALDLIISLYDGTNENFDLYDYLPESDDADKLTQYIVNKLCEI